MRKPRKEKEKAAITAPVEGEPTHSTKRERRPRRTKAEMREEMRESEEPSTTPRLGNVRSLAWMVLGACAAYFIFRRPVAPDPVVGLAEAFARDMDHFARRIQERDTIITARMDAIEKLARENHTNHTTKAGA